MVLKLKSIEWLKSGSGMGQINEYPLKLTGTAFSLSKNLMASSTGFSLNFLISSSVNPASLILFSVSFQFILVLDPDHIPISNFLDEVLGFFEDEKVGFVQVSQGYYNQNRSFTALAAAEQTYTFYGPTQMGMNGYNCSVAIGANCTFRRKALESAGDWAS